MKININGITWNVYKVQSLDDGALGYTFPKYLKIEILDNANVDVIKTTITHELVHAYLFSYGFREPNDNSVMLFSEEQLCDFIAMNTNNIMTLSSKVYNTLFKRV